MSRQTTTRKPQGDSRRKQNARRGRNRQRWTTGIAVGVGVLAILGVVLGLHFSSTASTSSSTPNARMGTAQAVGLLAPAGTFTTTSGRQVSIASLRGKPTLLWFVTTWCTSCQAGTQVLAQNLSHLQADGVHVVEVELYQDLGQSGPSISSFGQRFAGALYGNSDWTFATSSSQLTRIYDPESDLEIYYLLNAKGQVSYVNSPLVSTVPQLLEAAKKLA